MFPDHARKFRHDLFVGNQVAAIGSVDADLDERRIVSLTLGDAANGFGSERRAGQAACLGKPLDDGQRLGIKTGGDAAPGYVGFLSHVAKLSQEQPDFNCAPAGPRG